MGNDQRGDSERRFRLRGEVGGTERFFPLAARYCKVGSADSNDVVLHERGVSRRHAILSKAEAGWAVEDLGSKNGTLVNGRAVEPRAVDPQTVSAGDELSFGPVRLVLEEVDPDDAELGLEVHTPDIDTASEWAPRETTFLSRLRGAPASSALRWIEAFLGHLTVRPDGHLEGALALVTQGFESAGAGLVEWSHGASPVVVAASGEIGEIPAAGPIFDRIAGQEPGEPVFVFAPGPPAVTSVARATGAREAEGLVIWGGGSERSTWEPLLAALLRVLHHFRPRHPEDPLRGTPDTEPAGAAGEREGDLRFPPGIVRGEAPAMVSVYQQMRSLLQGDVPVLIQGETGVGKEHLAQTLHASSPRRARPFVAVNCAAIPAELLEAEMFGIGKGVATGVQPRPGKFVEAQGGTLFLDEIGDMPNALQAKLLRALQEKEIHPLGLSAVSLDVRVIAATNTDLMGRIEKGRFRQDLYYRIAGYVLEVPPLRRRQQDIGRLIGHFTRLFCRETGKPVRGITVKALRVLSDYAWPGNVRQLEHEVRRLVYLCPRGQAVDSGLISDHILYPPSQVDELRLEADTGSLALDNHLEAVERRLIRRALAKARGNQTAAAKLLGVSRNGLAKRLKRLGIEPLEAVAWK